VEAARPSLPDVLKRFLAKGDRQALTAGRVGESVLSPNEKSEAKQGGSDLLPRPGAQKPGFVWTLPVLPYEEAWRLQVKLVAARQAAVADSDMMLLLEHPPVFTLGRRAGGRTSRSRKVSWKNPEFPYIT